MRISSHSQTTVVDWSIEFLSQTAYQIAYMLYFKILGNSFGVNLGF